MVVIELRAQLATPDSAASSPPLARSPRPPGSFDPHQDPGAAGVQVIGRTVAFETPREVVEELLALRRRGP
jgi:hypothetical protein